MSHNNVNNFLDGFIPKESILLRSILNEAGNASLESKHIFDIKAISSRILGFATIPVAAASIVGYSLSGVGKLFRVIDGNPLQALKEAFNDELSALKSLALTIASIFYSVFGLFGDHYVYASCMTTDKPAETIDRVDEVKNFATAVEELAASQIKNYEAKVAELTAELETLRSTQNKNQATLEDDNKAIKELETQLEESRRDTAFLSSRKQEVEAENLALESRVRQLSLKLEQQSFQASPLLESQVSRLTAEAVQLANDLKEANNDLAMRKKEYKALEKKLAQSEDTQEKLTEKYNSLVDRFNTIQEENNSLKDQQKSQANGKEELEKKISELKALQLSTKEKEELKKYQEIYKAEKNAHKQNLLDLETCRAIDADLDEQIIGCNKLLTTNPRNQQVKIHLNEALFNKAEIQKKIRLLTIDIEMYKKREEILKKKAKKDENLEDYFTIAYKYFIEPVVMTHFNYYAELYGFKDSKKSSAGGTSPAPSTTPPASTAGYTYMDGVSTLLNWTVVPIAKGGFGLGKWAACGAVNLLSARIFNKPTGNTGASSPAATAAGPAGTPGAGAAPVGTSAANSSSPTTTNSTTSTTSTTAATSTVSPQTTLQRIYKWIKDMPDDAKIAAMATLAISINGLASYISSAASTDEADIFDDESSSYSWISNTAISTYMIGALAIGSIAAKRFFVKKTPDMTLLLD